jgi:hypothetical protein
VNVTDNFIHDSCQSKQPFINTHARARRVHINKKQQRLVYRGRGGAGEAETGRHRHAFNFLIHAH